MLRKKKKINRRHLPDSNRRGRSPVDFESTALTTRPRCRLRAARRHRENQCGRAPRPCVFFHSPPVFHATSNADQSYHAGVSSDRTNLSPFTKDYRGLALPCDLKLFAARKGANTKYCSVPNYWRRYSHTHEIRLCVCVFGIAACRGARRRAPRSCSVIGHH